MTLWENLTLWDGILLVLIIIFLLIIIRNVYRLMRKRNEYMSLKEAQAQYARDHVEHENAKKRATDTSFEEGSEEIDDGNADDENNFGEEGGHNDGGSVPDEGGSGSGEGGGGSNE